MVDFIAPNKHKTRPDLIGSFGAVSSTHYLATSVAFSVLEQNGNAFDAAVAAAFVLHLVEPHLNGPGGELVALMWPKDAQQPLVLDGQGPAPANATINYFESQGFNKVPGSGALAAAVPGAVEAWLTLLEDFGTWELSDVLAPAISYAQYGYPLLQQACAAITIVAPIFRQFWPSSAQLWLPNGNVPHENSTHYNLQYAKALASLANCYGRNRVQRISAAKKQWKKILAENISFIHEKEHYHDGGTLHCGVITDEDIYQFSPHYENPLSIKFRGYDIYKPSTWSSGPVLLQILQILSNFADTQLDPGTALGAHRIIEAGKLAFSDREAFYGPNTPRHVIELLMSSTYGHTRALEITDIASTQFRPGKINYPVYLPPLEIFEEDSSGALLSLGEPSILPSGYTRGDTCHLDIVDRYGNAISATPSGGWLQSSPTLPGVGFALGTRLQMTWLDRSSPSALMPGKKPRTTLSPTIIGKNNNFFSALGTPGGDQQDQWQVLYLLRTLLGGYSPQQAIDAPVFHTTAFPGSFWPRGYQPAGVVAEQSLGSDVIEQLVRIGHAVTPCEPWTLGRLTSVKRMPNGQLWAAANSRGNICYAQAR